MEKEAAHPYQAFALWLHGLALLSTGLVAWMYFDAANTFSYHPVLMTAAYLLFMAEGILTSISFRTLVGDARVSAIYTHLMLTAPGNLLMLGAFYAIYSVKVHNGKDHFTTTHGQMGLASMVASIGAQVGGAISFRKIGLLDLFPVSMRASIKTGHRMFGLLAWLGALATLFVGLQYPHMKRGRFTHIMSACTVGIAALLLLCWFYGPPPPVKAVKEVKAVNEAEAAKEAKEQVNKAEAAKESAATKEEPAEAKKSK